MIEIGKEELRDIIENKKIETVFQPIVSLKDGEVLGYEALSRAICEYETASVQELFASADKYNRLWELESLCRTRALETAYMFMVSPYNKKLFINVSPRIMHDETFKKGFTKEFLEQYKITPHNVIFEITEKNVVKDVNGFCSTISHYKNQKYKIAIDDAGSGYSGLNLISDIRPDYIKLDINLIRGINADTVKHAIVKGMAELSKATNIKLIAEGIETIQELKTIIDLGVQYGQGFYLQKPQAKIKELGADIINIINEIHLSNKQYVTDSISKSSIKYLCSQSQIISPDIPVHIAYETFKKNKDCFGLCVVENKIPIGIITKEKLALSLSGHYGYTLYQNKISSLLMDSDFLNVDCETPISLVASMAMARDNDKLYDFIVVTQKGEYLGTVTIKDLLTKSIEIEVTKAKQQNPLSGLPGNIIIGQRINQLIKSGADYSIAHIDIDNFKAYNDKYGFEKGDQIIKLLADILKDNIPSDQFLGHIGGDDFVVVVNSYIKADYFYNIVSKFESDVLEFYSHKDIVKGYTTSAGRDGQVKKFPLITLTVAVINNKTHAYNSEFEISAKLMELKTKLKHNKKLLKYIS